MRHLIIIEHPISTSTTHLPNLKLQGALHPILRIIHIQTPDLDVALTYLRRFGERGPETSEPAAEGTGGDASSRPAITFERELLREVGA